MTTKTWTGRGRRGRPRTERPAVEFGTPELQARRQALSAGADPALAEYPLGVLLARHLITAEQHEAGCYYGFLYGQAIGGIRIGCSRLYQQMAAEAFDIRDLSEDHLARIETMFRYGKNRLLAAGRRVCDATENLIVFGRHPGIMPLDGRQVRAMLDVSAELAAGGLDRKAKRAAAFDAIGEDLLAGQMSVGASAINMAIELAVQKLRAGQ